jgi:hypothetical protein
MYPYTNFSYVANMIGLRLEKIKFTKVNDNYFIGSDYVVNVAPNVKLGYGLFFKDQHLGQFAERSGLLECLKEHQQANENISS